MDDQRFGVADVGEVREKLHRFDAADARLRAAFHPERENAAGAVRQVKAAADQVGLAWP